MAMERVPYLVGGGFEHSAEVMRAMLAAATSGAEGLVNTGDMKVQPLQTPGTSVRVAPGNALIRNSYTGGTAQTYAARAASETQLQIEATSSAGPRTDLIVVRIDDPTYAGTTFDPKTFQAAKLEVIRGVPASQADVKGLNLAYPAIALARVTLPASTGTVTASHIKDLRQIALPRRDRRLLTLRDSTTRVLEPDSPYTAFPVNFSVGVPTWATTAVVRGDVSSMWINGSTGSPGSTVGGVRVVLGAAATPNSFFHHVSVMNGSRFGASAAGELAIPSSLRGTTAPASVQLSRWGGSANMVWDSSSVAALDIEFQERAS